MKPSITIAENDNEQLTTEFLSVISGVLSLRNTDDDVINKRL